MSETNQVKSSASGSESVGAALQAATVFGASDGLISESHEAEAKDREDALQGLSEEQWEAFSASSDDEEAQEEGSGTGKSVGRAGNVVAAGAAGAAGGTASAAGTAGSSAASPGASSAAGQVPDAPGDVAGGAESDTDEEDVDEEGEEDDSSESEESSEEEAAEEESSEPLEENTASESSSASKAEETEGSSSESTSTFEPSSTTQPAYNPNYQPEAVADDVEGSEGSTLIFDPLSNDIDVDVNDNSENFSLDSAVIVDSNGDPVSGQGSVSIVDNQIQFDPGSDFEALAEGEEQLVTVRYVMSDDEGAQSTATATITVTGTNDAPDVSGPVLLGSSSEDSLIEITESALLANASDVDGDQLSVQNLSSDQGTIVDNGNGSWSFTPNSHFSGTASFSFDVSDGITTSSAQASISLTAVADQPSLNISPAHNDLTIADHTFNNDSEGWTQMWAGSGHFASGNFLGRFGGSGGNQRTSNTYDVPQGVDELTLNFTFYEIDSWDGEEFRVFVDGQLFHARSYQIYNNAGDGAGTEILTNNQGDVIGQVVHDESMYAVATSSWIDQAHHYTLTIPVDPNAGQITIGFGSTLDEAKTNESWGIDNLNLAISGSTSDAIGLEDTAISLDVTSALVDTDGSESMSLTFSGLPSGSVLSAGQNNQDGSWTLSVSDLDALTITPPLHFNGEMSFTVTATSIEAETGESASTTDTITVNVIPVNDLPLTSNSVTIGSEDADYVFTLSDFPFSDAFDSGDSIEAVRISRQPDNGQILLDSNGDGSFETILGLNTSVGIADIDGGRLILRPEAGFSGQNTLDFQVSDGEGWSDSSATLTVVTKSTDAATAQLDSGTSHILLSDSEGLTGSGLSGDSLSVTSVNGQSLSSSGTTSIQGEYGVLQVHVSGDWSYTPDNISQDALSVTSSQLQDSLVAHWRFDQATNGAVADSATTGVAQETASLTGGATLTNGGLNGFAVSLDGVNDQVLVGDSTDINANTSTLDERTLSLAFQFDATNGLTGRQILYEEGASSNGIVIYLDNQTLYAGAYNQSTGWSGNYASQDVSSLPVDQWHHVTLVLDGSSQQMTAYLDGQSFASGAVYGEGLSGHSGDISIGGPSLDDGSASTNIFHDGTHTGGYFQGLIDDVRVYNRTLSEAEVEAVRYDFDGLVDHFDYTITNGSSTASSTLNVSLSRAPQAASETLNITEDSGYTTGQLQSYDPDGGDVLSYQLISGPDKGFVTIDSDGQYTFLTGSDFESLSDGESEQVSFTYSVTDLQGNQDTGTILVNITGQNEVSLPLGENLVTNPSAATGDFSGWTITENGGSGWGITGTSQEGINSFITSYGWGRKYQLIDLEAKGFSADFLDTAPEISASEWFLGIGNTSDQYYFKVELRGASQQVLDSYNTGTLTASSQWQEVSHQFSGYGTGVRYVYVEHGGKDTEYWAGHYGTAIDNTQIVVNAPEDGQGSLTIDSSLFQIVDGAMLGTDLTGQIVESNGFTSLDQWLLEHEGGALSVSLNTTDGDSWSAGVRLLHSDAYGSVGVEVAQFSGLLAATGQAVQVLELDDLTAGHYQLVLGNDGFGESTAGSTLDYPGMVSGEHSYEVAVSGQVSVAALPRDPGQHALISGETHDQTEGILTLAVVNNEADMVDSGNTLYYEVFNDDTRVGQGALDFSSGNSPQNIAISINNEPLETLTLDEIQVVFHEMNASGEVVSSQTFEFNQAVIPDGDPVAAQGGDGLQGLELMELGLDYFELGFSELVDDLQGQ
ncbi:tandem-95 repeat protein [Endozoicomonas atrinae]|uniref:tandem-95 repeat protein n=1 Tax=Endozoicomonas atrinae TaxID=1333660 RepID=UPI003B004375